MHISIVALHIYSQTKRSENGTFSMREYGLYEITCTISITRSDIKSFKKNNLNNL